jgi:uncharacterized protein (TIRG00374 family)
VLRHPFRNSSYSFSYITRWIKRNPFALIAIVMICYVAIALYADIGRLSNTKSSLKIDYWFIPLAISAMTAHILLLAIRFHRFLRAIGINDIPLSKSVLLYITGLSMAATPASSGQIIRSQIIKKQYDHAISKTSPIVLVEKWNELTAVILILAVFAFLNAAMIESILIIVIGIAVAFLLFAIMRIHAIFTLSKKIVLRFRRLKMLEESIENSQATLKILTSKKSIIIDGFLITTTAQICQAICVFFAFQALGIKLGFVLSTQIFFIALLSGILSFVPGGIFVTEGSMLGLLIKYDGANNYPGSSDIALLAGAVIFVRLATIWYGTFLGVITARLIVKMAPSSTRESTSQ